MTAMNDAGTTITETDMNETILQSTTEEGKTGVKGTGTSDAIRREAIFAEKSVGRQLEIIPQQRHRKIRKWKKPAG